MTKFLRISLFLSIILFNSCKTSDKTSQLNYLQNVEKIATDVAIRSTVSTIQVGDEISIYVTARDMSVVLPFNQNFTLVDGTQFSIANSNTPNANVTERSNAPIYVVDSDGYLDFPVLGKLNTAGKTLVELKEEIRTDVSKYVKDPTVNIKLRNAKVVVLGEVNKPGEYLLHDGQSNIFSALGLAGDLTMYGNRENLLLVRTVDGQVIKERIDLRDANLFNSPFYQLRQNDVIYVSSNETKEKVAKLDPRTNIYIALAGTVIGIAGIFVTIFK